MKKTILTLGIIFLLIGFGINPSTGINIEKKSIMITKVSNTLYVGGNGSGNYSKIQDAIDNASDGDSVFVYDESSPYYENIEIDKSISLIGEDKNTTIIDGNYSDNDITITADYVNISRFTIKRGDHGIYIHSDFNNIDENYINHNSWGIYIEESNGTAVIENNISNNTYTGIWGIDCDNNIFCNNTIENSRYGNGIYLQFSKSNDITGNRLSNNEYGIILYASDLNIIKNNWGQGPIINKCRKNIIEGNNFSGVHFWGNSNNNFVIDNNIWGSIQDYGNNNNIIGNIISGGTEQIGIDLHTGSGNHYISNNTFLNCGLQVCYSYNNTIINNTVNGKPLIYLENKSDKNLNVDAGQIVLVRCENVIISNLTITNVCVGVLLWESNNCIISGNNIFYSKSGIYVGDYSKNNIIINNTIMDNYYGILLWEYSNRNVIVNNYLSNKSVGIKLYYTFNNIIAGNSIISNYYYGLELYFSDNNTISGNNIDKTNNKGISLRDSYNNTITGNLISNNGEIGIKLYANIKNKIYYNNFLNNTDNSYDGYINTWYNINKSLGNYWDDYTGNDSNGDGVGDTPYFIPGGNNEDKYPLMELWMSTPPDKPIIEGQTNGKPSIQYEYTFNSTDLNNDFVMYYIDWGDNNRELTAYGDSGIEISLKHSWMKKGTYTIKAKAIDIYGTESDWTKYEVTITKSKSISSSTLLRFFDQFPLLQTLLMRLSIK